MACIIADKWVPVAAPQESVRDIASRTLAARLEAVQHYLPLAAEESDEDVEYVHQLRVWTRRAAAALKVYAALLPKRRLAWVKKQLKRLRHAANDARDCDVLAGRIAQDHPGPAGETWLEEVRAERAPAQRPIQRLYRRLQQEDRFDRRISCLLRRLRRHDPEENAYDEMCFGDWAATTLRPVLVRFFRAAPAAGAYAADLHRFRIRAKELRYAMELLAGAFPLEFREKLYPTVESLQDKLGQINDLAGARARLRRRLREAGHDAGAEHYRHLLAEEEERLARARRTFLDWCTPQLLDCLDAGFAAALKGFPIATYGPASRLSCPAHTRSQRRGALLAVCGNALGVRFRHSGPACREGCDRPAAATGAACTS
jgi:CHAD domain-containing protein